MLPKLSVFRFALAALALVAIGRQLAVHVAGSYDVVNFFSYFTNLSNFLAAGTLLASACLACYGSERSCDLIRYVAATCMAIVGIVFALLLRNTDLGALLPWVNAVLHYVMPVAVVADWLWQPPRNPITPRHLVLVLAFPALYLAHVLGRGSVAGWYPYPFLDPANVGGYGGVAIYSGGIFVGFVLVGLALQILGNRALRHRPEHGAAPNNSFKPKLPKTGSG